MTDDCNTMSVLADVLEPLVARHVTMKEGEQALCKVLGYIASFGV